MDVHRYIQNLAIIVKEEWSHVTKESCWRRKFVRHLVEMLQGLNTAFKVCLTVLVNAHQEPVEVEDL